MSMYANTLTINEWWTYISRATYRKSCTTAANTQAQCHTYTHTNMCIQIYVYIPKHRFRLIIYTHITYNWQEIMYHSGEDISSMPQIYTHKYVYKIYIYIQKHRLRLIVWTHMTYNLQEIMYHSGEDMSSMQHTTVTTSAPTPTSPNANTCATIAPDAIIASAAPATACKRKHVFRSTSIWIYI